MLLSLTVRLIESRAIWARTSDEKALARFINLSPDKSKSFVFFYLISPHAEKKISANAAPAIEIDTKRGYVASLGFIKNAIK